MGEGVGSVRVVCLDVGDRRIGVAVGDTETLLARPLTVIQRAGGRPDLEAVARLAREHNAERVVVGLPRSLDGTLGPQARKVQAFVAALKRFLDLPIEMWDERFSTAEAERLMAETGVRKEKRRGRVDAIAAAVILQCYLDSKRTNAAKLGGTWKGLDISDEEIEKAKRSLFKES